MHTTPANRPAALSVQDRTVRYRMPRQRLLQAPAWLTAVNRVSFEVEAGASLALVGESGSGKSSTAREVMAVERASEGPVRLFGEDVAALSGPAMRALRQRFQMVFQDPYGSLDPRYSVERIIGESIHDASRAEVRQRAVQVLEHVGLGAADLHKYPNQFSGGQRQRIAIARAPVTRPGLIVADEAVSALDVSVQAQVLNLMKDLQAAHGIAHLFISHDLAVVRYLCKEIVVLFRGAVVERGPTHDVLRQPAHPYTRELVEAVPRLGVRRRTARPPGAKPVRPADAAAADAGCAYRSRWARAAPRCDTAPALRQLTDGHQVARHFD